MLRVEKKNLLRVAALARRNALHSKYVHISHECYDNMFHLLQESLCVTLFGKNKPVSIGGYFPIGSEFNILPLLSRFFGHHHLIGLPVIQEYMDGPNDSPLVFWEWIPNTATVKGKFNIPIPLRDATLPMKPDILFAPIVAFDPAGRRLGYGGGFYDKVISLLRMKMSTCNVSQITKPTPFVSCGIAYEGQKMNSLLDVYENHDASLDYIITEKMLYECHSNKSY